ncbi:DUF5689 domain-containing protein [Altibacter sp. HG106]|uniref:DUF5689 domain-containing protein n=1 Tax=Altibacter sp. HG106 TaxID=3023937 RepID=UPI002350C7E0|nr:DUF5689 domain-containing protein [Altibacter sp. HG106]MDC7995136.1 DUF5689 domain-containing protein [Altibacter sp. HG106]
MKTFNFYKLFTLLFVAVAVVSCVADDDFDVPGTIIAEEPVIDGEVIQLGALAGKYEQEQGDFTYTDGDLYVEGYVVSNDQAGNFFEEIIIQDKPENPEVGLRVLVDVNPLFPKYEFGRKIFIKLDGLTLGISNGVLTLGIAGDRFIEKIPSALEPIVFTRSAEVAEIVPMNISIEDLGPLNDDDSEFRSTNLYVNIDNVQFAKNEAVTNNLTYASEPFDEFDGERTLESCASSEAIVFSTSTFADFSALTLPAGSGNVTGILTKNFEGEEFNIVVNSAADVNLVNEERCDPLEGFFFDDFESYGDFGDVEAAGWSSQNVGGGNVEWILGNFDNNQYAQVSGFSSGEDPIDVWLVTPDINMDGTANEQLTFDLEVAFDNGEILTVWYSTDYDGDASTATWTQLVVDIPSGPSSGFGGFGNIGNIDVGFIDGTVNFGFFYQGADPGATTRYHVDNVSVSGE